MDEFSACVVARTDKRAVPIGRRHCEESDKPVIRRRRRPRPAELFARALVPTGPAYEAIQNIGNTPSTAVDQAHEHVRDKLQLWAEPKVVAYLARKPEEDLQ